MDGDVLLILYIPVTFRHSLAGGTTSLFDLAKL